MLMFNVDVNSSISGFEVVVLCDRVWSFSNFKLCWKRRKDDETTQVLKKLGTNGEGQFKI